MRRLVAVLCMFTCCAWAIAPAEARKSRKKAIWGPTQVGGVSQFPIYRDLGAGIYVMELRWDQVAPTRPRRSGNPRDPAYRWPAEVAYAIRQARRYRIRVALMLTGAPRWANGGRKKEWAPRRPRDFASFARAASRRYPRVRHWLIWGEPSRSDNFKPLVPERRDRRLTRRMKRAPHRYARLLDASYASLKRQSRRNLVIGGNSFTTGDVSPLNWIRNLRLPNGQPPRMDLYGHNPFSARKPNLRRPPLGHGFADFSDLDTLSRWVDRYLGKPRKRRGRRRIKLFLAEFTIPTDHANHEFNFYVTRATQASWLRSALRITRRWSRIYTLGWLGLYDERPRGPNGSHGNEVHRGLLDWTGAKKPSYSAYKRG
jgi:hypothetical protein